MSPHKARTYLIAGALLPAAAALPLIFLLSYPLGWKLQAFWGLAAVLLAARGLGSRPAQGPAVWEGRQRGWALAIGFFFAAFGFFVGWRVRVHRPGSQETYLVQRVNRGGVVLESETMTDDEIVRRAESGNANRGVFFLLAGAWLMGFALQDAGRAAAAIGGHPGETLS